MRNIDVGYALLSTTMGYAGEPARSDPLHPFLGTGAQALILVLEDDVTDISLLATLARACLFPGLPAKPAKNGSPAKLPGTADMSCDKYTVKQAILIDW